jgi:hypothetical protein
MAYNAYNGKGNVIHHDWHYSQNIFCVSLALMVLHSKESTWLIITAILTGYFIFYSTLGLI